MSTFETALGQRFVIQRRLPKMGWKPRLRGASEWWWWAPEPPDVEIDPDDGPLAIIGAVVLLVVTILLLLPLLIFVAELALVFAVIIPLLVIALAVGLKQHSVVLKLRSDNPIVDDQFIDERTVRGLISSWSAGRDLQAAAEAGAYTTSHRAVPSG